MKPITESDYREAAKALGCSVAAVKAVAEVESAGSGFLSSGEPKILFEAHIFDRLTGGKYRKTHPGISSAKWDKSLYIGGKAEHARLQEAVALDRNAALQSASWGGFQVMGFNWKACGYSSLQAFVNDMMTAAGQLRAFVGYVKTRGLADELQRLDWAGFAFGYNGAGYAANKYDQKLAKAYARHIVTNPDFSNVTSAVHSTEDMK